MKVIKAENLSKKFEITKEMEERITLLDRLKLREPRKETIWALEDVSFEVEEGEWLGIIGENGSGKTTLLQVLAGILEPTEGEVTVKGKTASIIGLGTGFQDELTARENVRLYCSLMGLSEEEIEGVYDDIVSFSGLYEYMNTKFKKFSDGMMARLAFSAAMHVDADIILSDEILSVGDGEFQKKCLERMEELREEDRTIVFVSHSLGEIKEWCDRAIFLDEGKIRLEGDVDDVIGKYRKFLEWKGKNEDLRGFKSEIERNSKVNNLKFYNEEGKEAYIFHRGESLTVEIEMEEPYKKVKVSFFDKKMENKKLEVYSKNIEKKEGKWKVKIEIDSLWLGENRYYLSIEGDGEKFFEGLEVEVVKGVNEAPDMLAIKTRGDEGDFPDDKFYIFGGTGDVIEKFQNGESIAVYHDLTADELRKKFRKGTVVEGGEVTENEQEN